jgi:6-phosphogluconolactonase (cycloisomerase 2 family)
MVKLQRRLLSTMIALSVVVPVGTCAASLSAQETVFVMSNNAEKNQVIAFQRRNDGSYFEQNRFDTLGRGSGGTTDPLQSQGSLTLSGDHKLLFAINAGSGTISSFHLVDSLPLLVDEKPTGGAFPVAVAEHNGTVYVLNAGGNGAIVAFRADGIGRLHQIPNSLTHLTATNSGGSSISVSPSGQTLVVIEKAPNNIDTFAIHPDGTLGTVVINHSVAPGAFASVFTPSGELLVSENQPSDGTDTSTISSYTINANGTLTAISQSIPTDGNGNCWNAITPNGKWVFTDNSGTSTVAGFAVGSKGALTPIDGTILFSNPEGTTNLDMATSGDSKFLYTMDSGAGTVSIFSINSNGTLTSLGVIDDLPKTVGFNGIAAL